MALSQPAQVRGLLALLRSFSSAVGDPAVSRETYRSLVAPGLSGEAFREILPEAQERESACRAAATRQNPPP